MHRDGYYLYTGKNLKALDKETGIPYILVA